MTDEGEVLREKGPAGSSMGIRSRLFLLLLAVLVPILIIEIYIYYHRFQDRKAEELQANLEVARAVARTFDAFVRDVLHTQAAIGLAATASPPPSADSLRRVLKAAESANPMLRSFTWISPAGIHLVTTNPGIEGRRVKNQEEFSRIASGGDWAITPVYASPWGGEKVFTVSTAARSPEGRLLGVVSCTAVADRLDPLLAFQRSRGAGISLIDHKGIHLFRYPHTEYTPEQRDWLKLYPVIERVLRGEEKIVSHVSKITGETRLVAFAPIPSVGWVAAASRAEQEALAGIRSELLSQALWTLLVALCGFGMALALASPISRSVTRLRDHALALGRGEVKDLPRESAPREIRDLSMALDQMAGEVRLRENALRDSEAKASALIRYAPTGIYEIDYRGPRFISINDAMCQILGYTREELFSMDPSALLDESSRRRFVDRIRRQLAGEKIDEFVEFRVRKKDGSFLDAVLDVSVNLGGDPGRALVIAHDITERKRMERALRESEYRLRRLTDSGLLGVLYWSIEGPITDANDRFLEMVGYNREDLAAGRIDWARMTPPEYRHLDAQSLQELKAAGVNRAPFEKEYIRKDGTRIPVIIAGAMLDDARFNGVAFVLDVTERKRAQEALRESDLRFRLALRNAPVSVAVQDRDLRYVWAYNQKTAPPGGIIGRRDEDIFTPEEAERLKALKQRVLDENVELREQMWLQRPGGPIFLDAYWEPIHDHNGKVVGVGSATVNLTAVKVAEDALKKAGEELELRVQERTAELAAANKELQEEMRAREKAEQQLRQSQKMEAIGTLAGGIAHDLNNILAPMVINSELALLDLPPGSGLRENLQLVIKSGLRGKDLVKQLLLFGRRSEKKQEVISLAPVIHETFSLLRSSLPSTIQMKLSAETGSDAVYADPSQIQQVLLNLCTNAAHALPRGTGSIEISLESIRLGSLDLPEAGMEPGDYLVLSVKDTGTGMDAEVRKRIFEPFFTTKPVGEGTGLGLSVAYGIVEDHRGSITVYSEPGRGSVFKVYLPRARAAAPAQPESLKSPARGTERILLVDDEESMIHSVTAMLGHLGYEVTSFRESEEALKVFSVTPHAFDLVITDQTMPSMSGENLGKELMRLRADIPVILTTGYSDLVSAEKAKALGFRGFLMKPFTVREAAELVRRILNETKCIAEKGP